MLKENRVTSLADKRFSKASVLNLRPKEELLRNLEDRIEIILRTINASTKCTTLLLIPVNGSISRFDLIAKFNEAYSGTEFEVVDEHTPIAYCKYFASDGLASIDTAHWRSGVQKIASFSLTHAGRYYGRPSAALALYFESKTQISLAEVLGTPSQSTPGGHRTPFIRAMILKHL